MDINITQFFNDTRGHASYYSASCAELGDNAGRITWENAVDRGEFSPLLDTEEKREAMREFVRGFGAWTDEEINAWSDVELTALLIQFIAGDMRESGLDCTGPVDWEEYQEACESGQCAGRIYGGPLSVDGQIYFSLDS